MAMRHDLNTRKFNWTDQTIDRLKELHAANLSDSRISKALSEEFGHVSRNAIIGKRHRLGLSVTGIVKVRPAGPKRTRCSDGVRLEMRKQSRKEEIKLAVALPFECKPVSLVDLEGCSWPIDQEGGGILYCNNVTLTRDSYCAHHRSFATRGIAEARKQVVGSARHLGWR